MYDLRSHSDFLKSQQHEMSRKIRLMNSLPSGKLCMLFVVLRNFSKYFFLKNHLKNAITVSYSLNPDQTRLHVGSDLVPNWCKCDQ